MSTQSPPSAQPPTSNQQLSTSLSFAVASNIYASIVQHLVRYHQHTQIAVASNIYVSIVHHLVRNHQHTQPLLPIPLSTQPPPSTQSPSSTESLLPTPHNLQPLLKHCCIFTAVIVFVGAAITPVCSPMKVLSLLLVVCASTKVLLYILLWLFPLVVEAGTYSPSKSKELLVLGLTVPLL